VPGPSRRLLSGNSLGSSEQRR